MVFYTDCIQQCSRPLYMVRVFVFLGLLPEKPEGGAALGQSLEALPNQEGHMAQGG